MKDVLRPFFIFCLVSLATFPENNTSVLHDFKVVKKAVVNVSTSQFYSDGERISKAHSFESIFKPDKIVQNNDFFCCPLAKDSAIGRNRWAKISNYWYPYGDSTYLRVAKLSPRYSLDNLSSLVFNVSRQVITESTLTFSNSVSDDFQTNFSIEAGFDILKGTLQFGNEVQYQIGSSLSCSKTYSSTIDAQFSVPSLIIQKYHYCYLALYGFITAVKAQVWDTHDFWFNHNSYINGSEFTSVSYVIDDPIIRVEVE